MSLSLSTKDIHFVRHLFKYLSFFLVTPWYDFQKRKLCRPHLCKFYGCLLLIVKFLWIVHTVTDEYFYGVYQKMLFSQKFFFSTINLTTMALNILTIVKNCFWDGERWKTLLINFEYIDDQLRNKGKRETCVLKNFYCRFFVQNMAFLLVVAYQVHVWSTFSGLSIVKIACISKEIYYEFLTICLLTAIVKSFKSRYEDLNRKLLDLSVEIKIRDQLRAICHEYRVLGTSVDTFNEIFGYQIILIIFHCGLELVSALNIAFVSFMVTYSDGFHAQIFLAGLSLLVCVFYNFLRIVLPIDWTMQEAHKFLLLSSQIQEKFVEDTPELEGFVKLLNSSKDFAPKFTAAGFFKIDKGLIFSVVANVATYFIITIQLNEANIGRLLANKN